MLISKQQRYMLDTLVRQAFCRGKPEIAPRLVESAMRQLTLRNMELEEAGNVYRLRNEPNDPLLLEAVDVMLQLSGEKLPDFRRGKAPVLLYFSIQENTVRCFTVANYSSELRGMDFPESERIILLFDGQGQPRTLPVSNKQFIAVREENGSHRFFSRGGK